MINFYHCFEPMHQYGFFSKFKILFFLFIFKVAYILLVLLLAYSTDDYDYEMSVKVNNKWFDESWENNYTGKYTKYFTTWDALHYLYLSDQGYDKGVRSSAFYPLWPLTIHFLMLLFGSNGVVISLIASNFFSLIAWYMFYLNVRHMLDDQIANNSLIFLILFPGSLFYQFIYSESLCLFLIMLMWRGMQNQNFLIVFASAFCLPLVKAIGVFFCLPLFVHFFLSTFNISSLKDINNIRIADLIYNRAIVNKFIFILFISFIPILGFILYFFLIWLWTGNMLEGIQAQRYWGNVHSIDNLWNLPNFILSFFDTSTLHGFRGSVLDRVGFLILIICMPVIWKLGNQFIVWTYVLAVIPAMSGTFTSFLRYESLVFPLFIALSVMVVDFKAIWIKLIVIFNLAIVHYILLCEFINYRWAG